MLITGEAGAYVGVGGEWETSVPLVNIAMNLKLFLKKKKFCFVLFVNKKNLVAKKRKRKSSGRDKWEQYSRQTEHFPVSF